MQTALNLAGVCLYVGLSVSKHAIHLPTKALFLPTSPSHHMPRFQNPIVTYNMYAIIESVGLLEMFGICTTTYNNIKYA